jgi:hypothetical protein
MYRSVGIETVCRNQDIRNVFETGAWRAIFLINLILSVKETSLGTLNEGVHVRRITVNYNKLRILAQYFYYDCDNKQIFLGG